MVSSLGSGVSNSEGSPLRQNTSRMNLCPAASVRLMRTETPGRLHRRRPVHIRTGDQPPPMRPRPSRETGQAIGAGRRKGVDAQPAGVGGFDVSWEIRFKRVPARAGAYQSEAAATPPPSSRQRSSPEWDETRPSAAWTGFGRSEAGRRGDRARPDGQKEKTSRPKKIDYYIIREGCFTHRRYDASGFQPLHEFNVFSCSL